MSRCFQALTQAPAMRGHHGSRMFSMNNSQVENQTAKIVSAWALIGITSWAEAASFAAFLYSLLLISEWCWKKVGKPLLIRWGYIAAPTKDTADGE
jgi:hypothetical protein